MVTRFDAIVIGTGQAGPSLAARLTSAGMKVAIIERKLFGGTCVNTGCIPTKSMVASAYAAHVARRASEYGVVITGGVSVDLPAVMKRKEEISAKSRMGVEKWLRENKDCTVFTGHARFTSAHEVKVNDDVLTAEKIFINVGGRALVPDMPGVQEIPYLTNVSMMHLEELPRHLVVIGGSYVGLEFGQMFRRFGSEVTIIEKGSRLAHQEDEETSAEIQKILEGEGIHVRLHAECLSFAHDGKHIAANVSCEAGSPRVVGSHVLLAVGRRPNTDDLGLDAAGIECDHHGYIKTDDELQTGVPGVYALGDCNGKGAFTHTSYNDFEIVAANLLDHDHRKVSDRKIAYNLYIDPPLGRAGLTEAQVRASGRRALVGTRAMTRVGRAVEKGETQGFMKVLVDAETKKILGAAILGTGGDEVIHCLLDVMYADVPYTVLQRSVNIHPTVSELVPTVLGDLKPLE